MKNLHKSLAIAAMLIGITSCNEEPDITESSNQEAQLKSYTLTTAEDGSYILEHTLSEGVSSSLISNALGNEIILSEGYSNVSTKTAILPLINNEIKIDFITENVVAIPGIKILDEKTSTTAASKDIDYITNYSISLLNDGSYQLDFTLANNYIPNFTFNEELNRYEVILVSGDNQGINTFSENFLKFEGIKLNIVFLRSITTTTLSARNSTKYYPEPPELMIE